jgi:excisionase family DNA binding protein
MKGTELAASLSIRIARARGLSETGPDELLLGCLLALSRFGVVRMGRLTIDLEALGIDWLALSSRAEASRTGSAKVSYSEAVVGILDRAAAIARADAGSEVRIEHMLVAFTGEERGVMGELKRLYGIDGFAWREAAASLPSPDPAPDVKNEKTAGPAGTPLTRAWLTPEEAAEALGIHVQTLRAYVRSGKLPALRLAGERAIRILRADLDKVLEPLVPEEQ